MPVKAPINAAVQLDDDTVRAIAELQADFEADAEDGNDSNDDIAHEDYAGSQLPVNVVHALPSQPAPSFSTGEDRRTEDQPPATSSQTEPSTQLTMTGMRVFGASG